MDKRNWLWKRKSSERSSGETESSGSISLHSERYSDEQDIMKESINNDTQSPEVTSKARITEEEFKESVKILTEKLTAALVNVSAKEDLVKQHSKVAEEAVAGWEKAENEATGLKKQLEAVLKHNTALEVRVSHLDSALKECVKQLRQANEDAEVAKFTEFDVKIDLLEEENSKLKSEVIYLSEELEIRTIERDLSAKAAENASKQQLESIKKVAKLEIEVKRLQNLNRKSSIKNEKIITRDLKASSVQIDMMDDFLEMERLASLDDTETKTDRVAEMELQKIEMENMTNRVAELEEKLVKLEKEKIEVENELNKSQDLVKISKTQLEEADNKLEEMNKELIFVSECKESLELKLIEMEEKARKMEGNIECLKIQIGKEKNLWDEMEAKNRELEMELMRKSQEVEVQKTAGSNGDVKVKQEDLVVAADKLAECQKTIASLGRQLQSLATLEDFLIDTTNLPAFSGEEPLIIDHQDNNNNNNTESWNWHSNGTFVTGKKMMKASDLQNENEEESTVSSSSSSTSSTHNLVLLKSRNGFGKVLFNGGNGV